MKKLSIASLVAAIAFFSMQARAENYTFPLQATVETVPIALIHGQFGGTPTPFEALQQLGMVEMGMKLSSKESSDLWRKVMWEEVLQKNPNLLAILKKKGKYKEISAEDMLKYHLFARVSLGVVGTILHPSGTQLHHAYYSSRVKMSSTDQVVSFAPMDGCRAKVTEQMNITGGEITFGTHYKKTFTVTGTGVANGTVNYAGCPGVANSFPDVKVTMTFTPKK